MAAVIFFGAVSCAKEDISSSLAGGEVEVTFTANLPELGTRAYGDGLNANLLRCWVYDANGSTEDKHLFYKEVEQAVEGSRTFTFTLPLIKGMTYDFVLWADKDGLYKVEDGIVTVDYTEAKVKANDNNRDAFYGFKRFDPLKDTPKFTLTRPFAQLNAATSENMEDIEANGLTLESSSIKAKAYTQFNIKACDVVDSSLTEVTLAAEVMPYKSGNELKENYTYLAMGYLLAPAGGMVADVTFCFNGKKGGADFTVGGAEGLSYTNVPLKQNFRTNILGQLLTKSTEIEVEINPGFGGDAEDVKVFSGIMNEPIEIKANGTYIFDNLTVVVDNEDAVNIADNLDNVVISILGKVHLESKNGSGIGVEGSSALTLKGGNITARSNGNHITAKGNGNHAFGIGGNNAIITLDGVTVDYACGGHIQPLFENDLKYGKSEPEGGPAIGGAEINILNSTITKVDGGSKAAAIGASYHQSTNIRIEKSTILEANGGNASAGIGGSRYSQNDKYNLEINIIESNVTATGGQFGAGIGSGYDTYCNGEKHTATNKINIDANSTVYAKGGKYAAGIGTGFHAAYLTGAIETGATITANAGDETFYKADYTTAQNIGYGVMDPTREFSRKNATVTYKVNGQLIEVPFPRPVAIILGSENATEFYSTTTLAGALETSKDKNMPIVRLIADVEVNEILTITHSCTLDLNGKTLTGTANRLIRVSENEGQVVNVTIKNGKIVNTAIAGRCVETRSGNVNLTLEGVELIASHQTNNNQVFTVGGNGNNINVTIKNSNLNAGKAGYGIVTFNPVTMTIENSTVNGYGALYTKAASSSLGSAGSVFNIKGSTIISTNDVATHESNSFATVIFEDNKVTINVDADSSLKALDNKNAQSIFGLGSSIIPTAISGTTINVATGAELVGKILGLGSNQGAIGNNTILLPAEYAKQLSNYEVSDAGNGQVQVK